MLTKHKNTLITSELRERIVVHTSRLRLRRMNCPFCKTEMEMLTLDSAVTLSGVSTRQLIRLAELGKIHLTELSSGHLLFCRSSLESF